MTTANAPDLQAKLVALAESAEVSATRRIERLLPVIEERLRDGVSRETILKALRDDGIQITANTFSSVLYRLRKRAKAGEKSAPLASAVPAPVVSAVRQSSIQDIARSHPNMAELAKLGRKP